MIWAFRVHKDAVWIDECPTTFMDLMHKVFQPYLDRFVMVFVDDVMPQTRGSR